MEFIKLQIGEIIGYFTRRRWLYKLIGWGSFLILSSEITTVDINKYYPLNFEKIEAKYGQEITAAIAFVVDKFASEPDMLIVGICFIIILICLYIDYRISTANSNKKTIWNLFFGVVQNVTLNQNDKDEN